MKILTELVEGHTKNATNAQEMFGKIKAERDDNQKKLDEWVLKERTYLRILNDFHKECMQNQELRDQVESHS
jgi:hypothetical protein